MRIEHFNFREFQTQWWRMMFDHSDTRRRATAMVEKNLHHNPNEAIMLILISFVIYHSLIMEMLASLVIITMRKVKKIR